jgi:DUF1365 family protein
MLWSTAVSSSCIYEGTIRHRRFAVRPYEFTHRLALAYVDLDELPRLLDGRLTARRPGLLRFRRRDYLGDRATSLPQAVRDAVHAHSGRRPDGPVRVLTQLRSWGHCFNPVSFYYCFDPAGEHIEAVIAEVTNTPWGERYCYVLAPEPVSTGVLGGEFDKALHVSPFMDMDHRYTWRLTPPAQTLSVQIESRRAGALQFDATLALRRYELTRASVARMTVRYPLATVRVLALIYAHALRLRLKGVPVHPRPRECTG